MKTFVHALRLTRSPCQFLCFLIASLLSPTLLAAESDRPNIIYIMTDDLGYGDLGCYGQKVVETPNLDRMAAEGMRFTDHYAGHTVCRPSRLVLWTGQHVGHTGLTGNRPRNLTGMEGTVAQQLKAAGYVTGGVGKWALGNVDQASEIDNAGHPNNNGFDYWFGYLNQSNAHNFYPTFLWENKTQVPLPGNVIGDYPNGRGRVSSKRVTYSHDRMTDAALKFVRDHKDEPFLLHIHWTIPHANNEGGRVSGDGMEVPDYAQYADKKWPNPEKGFAAMVSRMDGDVGRLMTLLKELGLDEKTLVLFTSDNGPHKEGGHDHEYFDSNGPLKGYKRSMHDGGIRVPMIARWPGKIHSGSMTDHPSAFWDFLPTACELAKANMPEKGTAFPICQHCLANRTNRNSMSICIGPVWRAKQRLAYEWENGSWFSTGPRSSVERPMFHRRSSLEDWRLYDLTSDIGEENDIAKQHPEIVQKMLGLLERDGLR